MNRTRHEPADFALLDDRRAKGLCSMCGEPLTAKEKTLEGVGGSSAEATEGAASGRALGSGNREPARPDGCEESGPLSASLSGYTAAEESIDADGKDNPW